MLLTLHAYLSWFDNDTARKACTYLNIPYVPAKKWVPIRYLYLYPIPNKFDLVHYLKTDRLHGIYFTYGQDVLFHPEKVFRIKKNELAKRLRRK